MIRFDFLRRLLRGERKALLSFIFMLLVLLTLLGASTLVLFAVYLPDPTKIEERFVLESTKIYDRTGKIVLYDIFEEEKRTVVPLSEISDHLERATVAIEDQQFYEHHGIDLSAIMRAFFANLTSDRIQGGSTITQQFVKRAILSPERTLWRKIKEAILALEIERRYDKGKILELYLNQIPYGSNAYGAEAAAQTFFDKQAKDLTLAESALLAALPQAPTYYSPYGSHAEELALRKNYVLDQMVRMGGVSHEEAEIAKQETLEFSEANTGIKAPHFVFYIKELLEERYGPDYLEQGGLKIITTLDWDLQKIAEEAVETGAARNQSSGAYNASLVAIDPRSGQILSMVGSRSFFDDPLPEECVPGRNCKFEPNVNVATRSRQPGSAFKPFVYATAFKKGYTDRTILFDLFTEFNASCGSAGTPRVPGAICYHPQNFEAGRFRGPVTMRFALANSLNIPAVQTLYLAGIDDSINTARDMGITTLEDRDRFGLALVLGGGEVRLLEMVSGYGTFATEGIRHPIAGVLRVEDREGNIIEEFKDSETRALDAQIARMVTNVLADNAARVPVFGPNNPLEFSGRAVAAKTGTTNEFRDGWTLGYTPNLAVGVWAGNNNNTPMSREPGSAVAAPIWREFLIGAFEAKNEDDSLKFPAASFTSPNPQPRDKPILEGQAIINGEAHTILHYVDRSDPLGPPPSNPRQDPLYDNWESAVRQWFGEAGSEQGVVAIISPSHGDVVKGSISVRARPTVDIPLGQILFYFDDALVGSHEGTQSQYQISISLDGVPDGPHRITVEAHAEDGSVSRSSVTVYVGERPRDERGKEEDAATEEE